MGNEKQNNRKIAQKVWELYKSGISKSEISNQLNINRAEVSHIIKYTTFTLFLNDNESSKLIDTLTREKETLLQELNHWKYSNVDAYVNNEKIDEKLTYKRLSKLYKDDILSLKKENTEIKKTYTKFKKIYWVLFSIIVLVSFLAGGYIKGYFMKTQNYYQIDTSTSWESQEGDTLYRLFKKN
jgi:hypothetical protein